MAGLAISVDGVVESPPEWMVRDEEVGAQIDAMTAEADAILLGRHTYLDGAKYWPTLGSEVPLADFMNNTPKYIFSSTLDSPLEWANSHLVTGDPAEVLTTLKEQPGKDIVIPGSPTLVRSLLRERLIDQLSFLVHPVVVGSGVRLFGDMPDRVNLNLVDSITLSCGVLSLKYQPSAA